MQPITDPLPPLPEPQYETATGRVLFTRSQMHAYAAAAVAAERERAFTAGFDAGWRTAADWAGRDDLLSDMDSSAYAADQARALREQMKGASHD